MNAKNNNMNHFYQDLIGWFDFEDIYLEAVNNANEKDVFVEIGTANGKSAAFLSVEAANSGKGINVYTVDNTPLDYQDNNAKGVKARCQNLTYFHVDSIELSTLFKDELLGLVFLDGDHSYEYVSRELVAWWPKVRPGGIFAGHDYLNPGHPGVKKAVDEWAENNGLSVEIKNISWYIRKSEYTPANEWTSKLLGYIEDIKPTKE